MDHSIQSREELDFQARNNYKFQQDSLAQLWFKTQIAKTFTSTLAEGATPCGRLILVQIPKEKVCMNKYHQTQLITQLVNQINLFGSTLDPLPTRLRLWLYHGL